MLQGMTKAFAMGVAGALLATSVAAEDAPPELLLGELEADINPLPLLPYNRRMAGPLDRVLEGLEASGQTNIGEAHLLTLTGDSLVTFYNPYSEVHDAATASLVVLNADHGSALMIGYATIPRSEFPEGASGIDDPSAFSYFITAYAPEEIACMSEDFLAKIPTDEAREEVTGDVHYGSVAIGNGDLEVHFLQDPEMPYGVMEVRAGGRICSAAGAMLREPVEPEQDPLPDSDHIPVLGTGRTFDI